MERTGVDFFLDCHGDRELDRMALAFADSGESVTALLASGSVALEKEMRPIMPSSAAASASVRGQWLPRRTLLDLTKSSLP